MDISTQSDSTLARERVVVFGGLGFIGSHICRALVNAGYSVRIFDRANESHELIKDFEPRSRSSKAISRGSETSPTHSPASLF